MAQTAFADPARILAFKAIPCPDKRDLIARLIDRVICQPGSADIYFLPGVFPGASAIASSTLIDYSVQPLQLICQVRAGFCTWTAAPL